MRVWVGAFFAAFAAYQLARGVGIAAWFSAGRVGDSWDIAVCIFVSVLLLASYRSRPVQP